jgi:AraC-like DNA-binding protein
LTWLKEEDASLGELADRLGYQSEAAFSRAFKRFIGVSPGAARRNGRIANNYVKSKQKVRVHFS